MKFYFTFLEDDYLLITTSLTEYYDRYYSIKSEKVVKVRVKKEIDVPNCIKELFKFEDTKYRHIKADTLFSIGFSIEDIRKWNNNLKEPMEYFKLTKSEGVIKCNFYSFYGDCIPDDFCFKCIDEGYKDIWSNILLRNYDKI